MIRKQRLKILWSPENLVFSFIYWRIRYGVPLVEAGADEFLFGDLEEGLDHKGHNANRDRTFHDG